MELLVFVEKIIQLLMLSMIGLYFVFSNTVMKALGNFANGANVMVEINKIILNPLFYAIFFVSAIGSVYLFTANTGSIAYAGGVFFVGTVLTTIFKNVPLNNQLRDADEANLKESVWHRYMQQWVFWNHIRSGSAFVSGYLLIG